MEFIRETTAPVASPQVEASAKFETSNVFAIVSETVRTIATWLPITRQAADDLPELTRFISDGLLYALKKEEDEQILAGSNTGQDLNGLITQATAYAGTYNAASDTKLDRLRHAILELEAVDEMADFIVLHPQDAHDIDLIKDEAGGANTGNYVVGDPLGNAVEVRTFWGKKIVPTTSMTAGQFLVGSSAACEIRDRLDAVVDVSQEHEDFFTKNKLAVRAEERVALVVFRTTAFNYGSF